MATRAKPAQAGTVIRHLEAERNRLAEAYARARRAKRGEAGESGAALRRATTAALRADLADRKLRARQTKARLAEALGAQEPQVVLFGLDFGREMEARHVG